MKRSLLILALSIVLCGVVILGVWKQKSSGTASTPAYADINIGSQVFRVELARTEARRELGLSHRDAIGSDGMLFVFSEPQQATFWMKDMRFALDMVWIDEGLVTGVSRDVPPPVDGHELETRESPSPVTYVLEVPAGDASGISVGDSFTLSY